MPASRRTTLARRVASVVVTLLGAAAGAGCSSPDTPEPSRASPTPTSTPLASYDTDRLAVVRRDPCAAVPAEVSSDVLGGEPTQVRAWEPGQRVPGTPEVGDEWGCSLSSGDVTARAWVFAPPVARAEATRLAREAVPAGCRSLGRGTGFGAPGAAYGCDLAGGRLSGYAGRVGDAWVACELGPGDTDAAERWCVAVLDSLTGS